MALYASKEYPERLHDALVFIHYPVKCLYGVPRGQIGLPDPEQIVTWSATPPLFPWETGPEFSARRFPAGNVPLKCGEGDFPLANRP